MARTYRKRDWNYWNEKRKRGYEAKRKSYSPRKFPTKAYSDYHSALYRGTWGKTKKSMAWTPAHETRFVRKRLSGSTPRSVASQLWTWLVHGY
jgi:hypothetical protein